MMLTVPSGVCFAVISSDEFINQRNRPWPRRRDYEHSLILHEAAIAQSVIEIAEGEARQRGVANIMKIKLRIGEFRGVAGEATVPREAHYLAGLADVAKGLGEVE